MDFLTQNIGTVAVLLVLAIIVVLIIRQMRKDKKQGKSCTCGNSCSGCAMKGSCHQIKNK